MNRKGFLAYGLALLLGLIPIQSAFAANEVDVVFEKQFTSLVPIFAPGHTGDMNAITGFMFTADIFVGESQVGTATGKTLLVNPPLNLAQPYSQVIVQTTNTLPGIGSFDVFAEGVALDSSTTATQGDVIVSYSGSVSNGSEELENLFGLMTGLVNSNIFAQEGEAGTATETYRVRFGF